MTRFFNLIATLFFPIRYFLAVISLIAFIVILYLFVFSSQHAQATFLTPSLLILLWSLILFVLCHSFYLDPQVAQTSALHSTKKLTWFGVIKRKLSFLFLWLYSLMFLILMVVSFYFTLKVWML